MKKAKPFTILIGLFGLVICAILLFAFIKTGVLNKDEIMWQGYSDISSGFSGTTVYGEEKNTPSYVPLLVIIFVMFGSLGFIFQGLNKETLSRFFFGLCCILFGISALFFFSSLIVVVSLLIGLLLLIGSIRKISK